MNPDWNISAGLFGIGQAAPSRHYGHKLIHENSLRNTVHCTQQQISRNSRQMQAPNAARRCTGASKSSNPVTRVVSSEFHQMNTCHIYSFPSLREDMTMCQSTLIGGAVSPAHCDTTSSHPERSDRPPPGATALP